MVSWGSGGHPHNGACDVQRILSRDGRVELRRRVSLVLSVMKVDEESVL
jgi:hypothetical protein